MDRFAVDLDWCRRWQAAKWATVAGDVLPMDVGELDFRPPASLRAYIKEYIDLDASPYSEERGLDLTREKIACFVSGRKKRSIDAEHVYFVPSIRYALSKIGETILGGSDQILFVGSPGYTSVINSLHTRRQHIDFEDLGSASVDELFREASVKAILLINPNNPTGQTYSEEELSKVILLAKKHNCWVISDEINEFISYGTPAISLDDVSGDWSHRCLCITGFGKAFNINGYRGGYIVHRGDLIEAVEARHGNLIFLSDVLSQFASLACIDVAEEWLPPLIAHLNQNREYCCGALNALDGVTATIPDAGFTTWVTLNSSVGSKNLCRELHAKAKVRVLSGESYISESRTAFRLNFGTSRNILENGLMRITSYIRKELNRAT